MVTQAPKSNAPVSPAPRPSLALLVLLSAVFAAVRPVFERLAGAGVCARVDELLARGELAPVRSLLADYAAPGPASDAPPAAYQVAARALVAALDVTATLGAVAAREQRSFYARVSLLGHQDLGVCHVREDRLAGVEMLLVAQVTEEPVRDHWIRPQSCYQLTEISAEEALRAVHEAVARRERMRLAAAREERGRCVATVRVVGVDVEVSVEPKPGLEMKAAGGLLRADFYRDVAAAERARHLHTNDLWRRERLVGQVYIGAELDVVWAMLGELGFSDIVRGEDAPAPPARHADDGDGDGDDNDNGGEDEFEALS